MPKITELPAAAPLAGTENLVIEQGGATRRASAAGYVAGIVAEATALRNQTAEAAAQVQGIVPAYANPGGTGDRTAVIAVTASAGLLDAGSNPARLVNGNTATNSYTHAVVFAPVAVAGHWLCFDYRAGADKVITELKFYQTGVQTHGVWQAQVSNAAGGWDNVGATFTLGGVAQQTIATLAGNLKSGQMLRLLGVSGNTNTGGTPFIYELEMKIAGTLHDGRLAVPLAGRPGQAVVAGADGKPVWDQRRPWAQAATGALTSRIAQYTFDDGLAATRARNLLADTYHIDFNPAYGMPTFTTKGLLFRKTMQQTPVIPGLRTIAVLARGRRNNSNLNELMVSGGPTPAWLQGSAFNASASLHLAIGGTILPAAADVSQGVYGTNCRSMNRGGMVLRFIVLPAAVNQKVSLGGAPDNAQLAQMAEEFEIMHLELFTGALSTADMLAHFHSLRALARDRGWPLDTADCNIQIDAHALWGQSNCEGDNPWTDLSVEQLAMANSGEIDIMALGRDSIAQAYRHFAQPQPLRIGSDGNNYPSQWSNGEFGIEVGWAIHKRLNWAAQRGREVLLKAGFSGTPLALAPGGQSWNAADEKGDGYLWEAIFAAHDMIQHYLARGIGITFRSLTLVNGEQEAFTTAGTADKSLSRQADLQGLWNAAKQQLPGMAKISVAKLKTTLALANPAWIANVNTGTDSFVAANPDAAKIETESYSFRADGVHYNAASSVALGTTARQLSGAT